MAQLKVKTRGDSSPQGKQKVYFCCHPAEFAAFFEPITEEILAKQNCAVWYDDTGAPRDAEFLAQLQEMQLFVMPVTSRLLHTDSPAMDTEFPFAIARHIPVLPLMQESGLEADFNEKCGDLQFLDKYQTDPTAIPYEEKLEKYLAGVLVGDALAEKVRAAFDAYVFLSYRKKDRKHAQELMRLIHQNPFCRDIAIWYDEFLTPGENWSDAIRQALEKSGLFVLTVTPNLVNEPNYIQQIEYPMAAEQGKPVVPAEMVPTDREALADKYVGIPPCADAHDQPALSAALLAAVQKLAIEENDHSPEHNFFIGLAYLNGIDVEVDHTRALELITGAAEAELPEAVEKLVEMYRNGVGVVRDYEEAIRWQEKLIPIRETAYNKSLAAPQSLDDLFDPGFDSRQLLKKLLWSITDCGRYYREMGKLAKAKEKFRDGLEYLEKSPEDKTGTAYIRMLSEIYDLLGNISADEDRKKEALSYYEKSLKLLEKLPDQNTSTILRNLQFRYQKIGRLNLKLFNLKEAQSYFERCLEIDERLQKEAVTDWTQECLSDTYIDLGDACEWKSDFTGARAYYEKSLAIRERLAAEPGMEQRAGKLLSLCYNRLGLLCYREERYDEAKTYLEKDLRIVEQYAREADTVRAYQNLCTSYDNLGGTYKKLGDLAAAQTCFEQVLLLRLQIAEKAVEEKTSGDLLTAWNELEKVSQKTGDITCLLRYAERIIAVRKALVRNLKTEWECQKLGWLYRDYGDLLAEARRWPEAETVYRKAIELYEILEKSVNKSWIWEGRLPCYRGLGRLCVWQGMLSEARAWYTEGLNIAQKLVDQLGSDYQNLADFYSSLEAVCREMGDLEEADVYHQGYLEAQRTAETNKNWTLEYLDSLFDDD